MKCCICKDEIKPVWNDKGSWDKGNNPDPIIPNCHKTRKDEDAWKFNKSSEKTHGRNEECRCCMDCDENIVIPTRFLQLGYSSMVDVDILRKLLVDFQCKLDPKVFMTVNGAKDNV